MNTTEITQAHRRRLDELELRAARQGYQTPPEVQTEIDDIRRELDAMDNATMATSNLYLPEQSRITAIEKVVEMIRTQLFWMAIGMVSLGLTSLFLSIVALVLVTR